MEQPEVGPKGEGVGTTESNSSDEHSLEDRKVTGLIPCANAGSVLEKTLASELADAF